MFPIEKAIEICGSEKKVGELLDCSQQTISRWRRLKSVPAKKAKDVRKKLKEKLNLKVTLASLNSNIFE
jgi:hypothetical protein